MTFQRARKAAQIEERKEQIRKAAFALYKEGGLARVTFTNIAKRTTFTRPTIYTYYKNSEEILLDVLCQILQSFARELQQMFPDEKKITRKHFCQQLTDWIISHKVELRLFSIHHTQLEPKVRYELLVKFCHELFTTFDFYFLFLEQQCPQNSRDDIMNFICSLLFFLTSVYPLAEPSSIQMQAFQDAKPPFSPPPINESIYITLFALTSLLHFDEKEDTALKS
ncbi:TetR family transcriptional regulator [Mitsuokella sp.]|uniref:TetR family transcriptional regulator n=1 Tax=unclassified Mitsuokella TaxID=2637239 RepID=UPI003D7E2C25